MVDSSREGVGSACEGEVVEPVTVARGSVWVFIFSSICVHFCIPYAITIRIWNTPYPVDRSVFEGDGAGQSAFLNRRRVQAMLV